VSVSNNTLVHQPNYNFVAFSLNQNRISEWRQPNRSSVARPSMATQSHEQSPPLYLLLRHMAPRQRQAYLIQTCILRVIDSAPIRASCSTSSSEQFNSFIVPKRSVPGLLLVSVRTTTLFERWKPSRRREMPAGPAPHAPRRTARPYLSPSCTGQR
jgi:hypothetical protein